MDAVHPKESVGDGRSRVAAGGHEHIDLATSHGPAFAVLMDEILQQTGHETGAHILEGKCRAMEEFQAIDALLHALQRRLEGECVGNDTL